MIREESPLNLKRQIDVKVKFSQSLIYTEHFRNRLTLINTLARSVLE